MPNRSQASWIEKLRLLIYNYYYIFCGALAIGFIIVVRYFDLMDVFIDNSVDLSVTGVGIASFLFAVQGIMLAIPAGNPFMKQIRKDGRYFVFINRFCRTAEIIFLLLLLPMLFMSDESARLNELIIMAYSYALLLTLWIMWLMGKIIIISEKHADK